ncbi:DNA-binding protein isoform 1 [Schistosoma japonicum]|uniref:DNA-binding protein isoform 1 n=2 Tax=Schistosoma japonicum TaxID=6182 RepID=A0A4Z2DAY5_SCHJA|nr:DNA-binding protein isoform 1 [Schistosoma japonicum]
MLKSEDQDDCAKNGYDFLKSSLSSIITQDTRAKIDTLIQEVASLKDVEKLLFCLLIPVDNTHGSHCLSNTSFGLAGDDLDVSSGYDVNSLGVGLFSPGGQSSLHLSNQVEQSQAYTWIMSHLEEDPSTCLRKDEVYDDYRAYCEKHHMKTLNTADFGKVMKRAFPNVKPRRLGQRGQSRYCYGGMRKKTEIQPPYLPDLTNEALGINSQNTAGRSTGSPGSSSGGSYEAGSQRHMSTSSPLIRLLKSNGSDIDTSSWADDPSIRTALGIRGSVVADVAHILLEYGHQVFGVQFKSLFHLAQHLVANRYVNSRSKHAFALIAHAANPPASFSPPPTTALAEMLQKGSVKSAFGKIRNGRQNFPTSDLSSYKSECVKNESFHIPSTNNVGPPVTTLSRPTVSDSKNLNLSIPNVNHNLNNHGMVSVPPVVSSMNNPVMQMPHCTTPQRGSNYKSYELQTSLPQASSVGAYAAAVLASPSALQSSNQHLSNYPFNFTQNFRNNVINHPYPHSGAPGLAHPSTAIALAAAAAVAAHQKQQSGVSNFPSCVLGSAFPSPVASVPGPASPSIDSRHIGNTNTATPPTAHREQHSGLLKTSTPTSQSDSSYTNLSGYNSPITNTSVYPAHQITPRSQQPPAPLPPSVGARSPYAQVSHLSAVNTDSSQVGFKRTVLPHPGEAPGAYEPSPRFHLGGQSPNKRARYLSTASGSSSNSLSTDGPPLSGGSFPDGNERYSEQATPVITHITSLAVPSPASSGSSSSSAPQIPTNPTGYSGSCNTTRQYAVNTLDQSSSMPSPFYPGRYEGLEMHSPAPAPHGHVRSHHSLNNTGSSSSPWNVPGPLSSKTNLFDQPSSDYVMNSRSQNYNSNLCVSTSDRTNVTTVFRPPITPFTRELESEDDGESLPRLGTSPGPQIPPSSPTEFLPFYSEAANKSAQAQLRQKHFAELTPRIHNTPDSDDRGTNSDNSSPCMTLVNRDRSDIRNNSHIISNEFVTTPMTNPISHPDEVLSPCSSDSNDRTLTILDNLGEVNTPPMPDGLADAPSPSDVIKTSSIVRKREELQNELSTPGPADGSRSPHPNNSGSVQCSSSTDVSITAF